jgi:hypothetical protein
MKTFDCKNPSVKVDYILNDIRKNLEPTLINELNV